MSIDISFVLQAIYDCQPMEFILCQPSEPPQRLQDVLQRRRDVLQHLGQSVLSKFPEIPSAYVQSMTNIKICSSDHLYTWFVCMMLPMCDDVIRLFTVGSSDLSMVHCMNMLRNFFSQLDHLKKEFIPNYSVATFNSSQKKSLASSSLSSSFQPFYQYQQSKKDTTSRGVCHNLTVNFLSQVQSLVSSFFIAALSSSS